MLNCIHLGIVINLDCENFGKLGRIVGVEMGTRSAFNYALKTN